MKSVTFCFATHNHQPVGNFDYVIEEAYQRAYLPFLEMASRFDIRMSLHMGGILLEWLATHHSEYITLLRRGVGKGSIEIIGGGYYEPILSVISDRDKQAQLAKLSDFVRDTLATEVKGLWLAERIWEQSLCGPIANAGLKYVLLDDTHFRAAGLSDDDLGGYYLTEDQGHVVAAFPISQALRYTIPFRSVDQTIAVLREAASETGKHIVTFADDGEKFGLWPMSYDRVYPEGWLEEFFRKLSEHRSWIHMRHFDEAIREHKPKGRIYFPDASYAEMMQWALPTLQASNLYEEFHRILSPLHSKRPHPFMQFVRGGVWRNFFVKYPESNHLHKRVSQLSKRFELVDTSSADAARAYAHLLAAQCNDAYWHGVFGGVYVPSLRHGLYSNLLLAEQYIDTIDNAGGVRALVSDFDCDGNNDVMLSNDALTITLDCGRGGAISEISYKPRAFNITNFIDRREESYHHKVAAAKVLDEHTSVESIHDLAIVKEEGLAEKLVFDWYRHGSFIEHFLSDSATCDNLATQRFLEYGNFFRASVEPVVKCDGKQATLTFDHVGEVVHGNASHAIRIKKSLTMRADSEEIAIAYTLQNKSKSILTLRFASEWTFGLLAGDAIDRYYEFPKTVLTKEQRKLASIGEITQTTGVSLVDEWGGLRIDLDTKVNADIWRAPIESIASSEAGFERLYQGSMIFLIWNITFAPGESRSLPLHLRVSSI